MPRALVAPDHSCDLVSYGERQEPRLGHVEGWLCHRLLRTGDRAILRAPMPQKSWRRLLGAPDPSARIFGWGAWLLLASPILFVAYLLFFKGHCG